MGAPSPPKSKMKRFPKCSDMTLSILRLQNRYCVVGCSRQLSNDPASQFTQQARDVETQIFVSQTVSQHNHMRTIGHGAQGRTCNQPMTIENEKYAVMMRS